MKKFVFLNLHDDYLKQLAVSGKADELLKMIKNASVAQVESEKQEAIKEVENCISILEKNNPTVLNKLMPAVINKFVEVEDYDALVKLSKNGKYIQLFDSSALESLQQYYTCVTITEQAYKRYLAKNGKDVERFSLTAYNLIISYKNNALAFYKNGKKYVIHNNINKS